MSLFHSIATSAGALRAFQRVLDATENNVSNVSTPGYARQSVPLETVGYAAGAEFAGGVRAGGTTSARDPYADQSVRLRLQSFGLNQQQVAGLTAIEGVFDISGTGGIPGALTRLFDSFSEWTASPSSAVSRQAVIDRARDAAAGFQTAAAGLRDISQDLDRQLRDSTARINQVTARLRTYNTAILKDRNNFGLEAQLHNTLDELGELVDFTYSMREDGTVTVALGGQTLVAIGDQHYEISVESFAPPSPPAAFSSGPPSVRVRDAFGEDVTARLSGGRLAALLEQRNRVVPSLLGDANQAGDLNRMARAVADRVNAILASGHDGAGQPGAPLFAYQGDETNAAASLAVDAGITPAGLAAIDPGPPYQSNGIAMRLAALAQPRGDEDRIDGLSYIEFYGSRAARIGRQLADARDGSVPADQSLAQARSLREQVSGVSLDEEAAMMIQFQRAYQAASQMVRIINELTGDTISLLR